MTHGTYSMYTAGKCRCELCAKANSDYCKAYHETRVARLKKHPSLSTLAHGTRSKYNHDGCRCTECRAAQTQYIRTKYRTPACPAPTAEN